MSFDMSSPSQKNSERIDTLTQSIPDGTAVRQRNILPRIEPPGPRHCAIALWLVFSSGVAIGRRRHMCASIRWKRVGFHVAPSFIRLAQPSLQSKFIERELQAQHCQYRRSQSTRPPELPPEPS
jgi:hypothetical protein